MEENTTVKKPKVKKSRNGFFKVLQHIVISIAIVALVVVLTGSTVIIPMYSDNVRYMISSTDNGLKYEDSVMFNTIFGNEISDVLKYVTIRTQVETKGKYDPDKVIDVAKFNARTMGVSNQDNGVTAQYYLGDLLKWNRYGFEYAPLDYSQMSVSANALFDDELDDFENDSYEYYVNAALVNRYQTVDGRTVEECVDNIDDYNYLCDQIIEAADSLSINYKNYLGLNEYYNVTESNIRYCVVQGTGKDRVIYSNDNVTNLSDDKIAETFKKYGKYVFFDADRMLYQTNTAISESAFNNLFDKYEYALNDDCKIYIACDMSMPANDSIVTGKKGFANYLPYYRQLILTIVLCAIAYIALLVLCTYTEGRCVDSDGNKYILFTSFDDTSIELWIVLAVSFWMFIPYCMSAVAYINGVRGDAEALLTTYKTEFLVVLGVLVFLYDLICLNLFYSLVRRIKGRHIWKQSLVKKLCDAVKRLVFFISDNSTLLFKTVVPSVGVLLLNILCLFGVAKTRRPVGFLAILMLLCIDGLAIFCIYYNAKKRSEIITGMKHVIKGDLDRKLIVDEYHGDNREIAECVNSISDAVRTAVEKSTKDERMKTDLVANVSHDIRTPLTSIINYVDLIKRENIENENVKEYIKVIDQKSQRLKNLTDDLIEASKVSSGNVELNLVRMNFMELLDQAVGEFQDKFIENNLNVVVNSKMLSNPCLLADGKSLWRVMENLLGNVCKYSMQSTRVFVDVFNVSPNGKELIVLQIKNMSKVPLPEDLSELTERFIRGDESRTTEGSGLGLSIAKSLTELMGGSFEIASEADLFKVEISFETDIQ